MSEKDLKLTDLDYATGDHHLQMMKAALPYLDIRRQRSLSMFIRAREMMLTMEFYRENDDGMMSVCSLSCQPPRTIRFRAHSGTAVFHSSPGYAGTIRNPAVSHAEFCPRRICPWNNMIRKDPGNQIRGSITWMRKRSLYWLPSPMNWPQPQKLKE